MGPDPFSMPSFGSQSAQQNSAALTHAVGQAAPLATQWHGPMQGVDIPQVFTQPSTPKSGGGVLSNLAHFIGGIGSEIGHLGTGAASWLGHQAVNMVESPYHYAQGLSHAYLDNYDINQLNAQTKQNSDLLTTLHNNFKSGRITAKQYATGLQELARENNNLVEQHVSLNNRIQGDKQGAIKATIDTAAALTTILTAGFGSLAGKTATAAIGADGLSQVPSDLSMKAAADFLKSSAANIDLSTVEGTINRLATNPEAFSKLPAAAQGAVQKATAEIVAANPGTMTAGQISRASAANLALKYPIYFNMLSTQGQQIYQKLDDKKYGSAVQQLAINAALLLSGGPIGWALKQGGRGVGGIAGATFGKSSFIDELSKGIGDGNPSGLYNAINKISDPELQKEVVQNLSAVEATNMAAVSGKDSIAAAWRVLNGMSAYEGMSMNQFTHEEALGNMVNFAKAQKLADDVAKTNNLGAVTVGRLDVRALSDLAKSLTGLDAETTKSFAKQAKEAAVAERTSGEPFTPDEIGRFASANKLGLEDARQEMLIQKFEAESKGQTYKPFVNSTSIESDDAKQLVKNLWENKKALNSNQAWAVNENFDRQIKSLIDKATTTAELSQSIRSINAAQMIKGFPEAATKQLGRLGYIPISPKKLEAPFREGTGRLSTRFISSSDDFFLKAVQPLPVLGSVGSLLTHMGLSPTGSTSRVYQLFNSNLSEHITNMEFVKTIADKGATDAETADDLIKRLTNYAHNPSTFAQKAAPITDLRQMTTGDITKALKDKVNKSQAKDIKDAIMQSMLEVPLTVRGLGDKIVDTAYAINPLQKGFMRIQQGARFAWNPFFQTKLAYKTEILSQAEAGGKFPTIAGTNTILSTIFPDKYGQLDKIRGVLRNSGIFDERARFGEGLTGEAVNDAGVAGANLTHKLLPSQERSIAGMVSVQADKLGLSVEDFVKYHESNVRDTVQMIAQYDRNSVFLQSAMARTLNLAFFPFRFEYKVAAIMARSLAARSTMTQLAVINGLYRAHDWLNSPEGQAWYSHNAEVIGLVKYFTPIQTLGEVSQILGMKPDSIGSFGELGGLPFGWIPQLLDAEGITNLGGGYVSPKSGQVIPDYVPTTDKGKLAAAIQDLIGALYTYPGATAGLPSKTNIDRNIALGLTGASKKNDFEKVNQPISQRQQNFADAIQAANPAQQNTVPKNQQIRGGTPNPTVPGLTIPRLAAPIDTLPGKQSSAGSSSAKKKKKADFVPALLPGQSQLGQL